MAALPIGRTRLLAAVARPTSEPASCHLPALLVSPCRGQDVRSHKWLESGHVSHYRLHAAQYRGLVFDFLQPLLPAELRGPPRSLRSKL